MRFAWTRIVLLFLLLAKLAAGQASAPSKVPRASTPPAPAAAQSAAGAASGYSSPAPTPPRASTAAQAPAPITTGPQYSPAQLDFGALDYRASVKRTFSLIPPAAGEITLEFPVGSFVAAEVRRVPPLAIGKPQAQFAKAPPMKPVPASSNGGTELYKWNFAAGEEMQLDILFAPSFARDKAPGLRTAMMKLSGPGIITPWNVTIPMRGTVNGQVNAVPPPGALLPAQRSMKAAPAADARSTRALMKVLQTRKAAKIANPQSGKQGLNAIMADLKAQQSAVQAIRANRGTPMSTRSGPGNTPAAQAAVAPVRTNRAGQSKPPEKSYTSDDTVAQGTGIFICDQPKIRWVDKRYNTIFTPLIKQSNGNIEIPQHTIEGCQFGKQSGLAYLVGNFKKGQLPLKVNYWSDSEIDVALDPTIEGELDESNVTLVVKLADGTFLKASGYRFYATRGDPVALYVYPDYALNLEGTLIKPTTVITPLDGNQPGVFVGRLARRFEGQGLGFQGNIRRFDRFYLTKLTQGFSAVEADLTYWFISQANGCIDAMGLDPSGGPYENIELWSPNTDIVSTQWGSDYLEVDWTPQYCAWKAYASNSLQYAVTIYVVGPKGVKPWADGKQ